MRIRFICVSLLSIALGCGGATEKRQGTSSPPPTLSHEYPTLEYVIGVGEVTQNPANQTLEEAAGEAARAQIARVLWTEIQSTVTSSVLETEQGSTETLASDIQTRTSLDPRLNALIIEAKNYRRCDANRCKVVMVLNRSEASVVYQNAMRTSLSNLRQHTKTAMMPSLDLFAFAGSVNAAQTAYAALLEAQYRLRAIYPRSKFGLPSKDAAAWQALTALRSKRLANLSVTIKPAERIELVSDLAINGAVVEDGLIQDAALSRSVSAVIESALRDAQLRSTQGDSCSKGLIIEPAAVVACDERQGFTFCTLEITGSVKGCEGGAGKNFAIKDPKLLRGVVESNEYRDISKRLRKALGKTKTRMIINNLLSGLLPIAQPQKK